jgi:excisionase family DNA binding protein
MYNMAHYNINNEPKRFDLNQMNRKGGAQVENNLPDMLTPEDIQEYLRIGRTKTYELLKAKPFPVLEIGRSLRIPKEAFINWVKESKAVQV